MASAPSRRRTWCQRAVAAVLGAGIALGCAEGWLRLFAPQPLGLSSLTPLGLTLHIPGARIRYRRSEFDNVIQIKSLGLRDREIETATTTGVFRILVLGDSYAEGKQVSLEEIFPKQLESVLRGRFPARRWEVVNGGVSGYGTEDEIKFFEVYGRSFDPDLVLLAFCVGNDLDDNRRARFFRWDGSKLEERPLEPLSTLDLADARAREFAASHSHLYQFLRDRYTRYAASPAPEPVEEPAGVTPSPTDSGSDDWRRTEALLDRLRELVTRSGARLLLVAVPQRAQVFDDEWAAVSARPGGAVARDQLQQRLAAYAGTRGLPFLDLLPALRVAARTERTHFRIDGHFNARGHAVAGREIFESLVKFHLLGDTPSPP